MNMIERMARAICAERWEKPECGKVVDELWEDYIGEARAVLRVIKNPTPEMLNSAHECTIAGCCLVGQEQALDVWEEMVKTAMEEK